MSELETIATAYFDGVLTTDEVLRKLALELAKLELTTDDVVLLCERILGI